MAKIIGGIAASHTPTIGFAKDTKTIEDPAWAEVFKMFQPINDWLAKKQPDVLFFIYNDHITSFFLDHYSPFVLGVDDEYVTADEGGGARQHPPVSGHAELSRHIGKSLFADEFDISFYQKKPIDHGLFSPLSMMTDRGNTWSGAIVPLQVGVLQFPIPTAKRCFKLGKALRRAIESFPEDISVALVATGGLSHQVHGERCGFNNPQWDEQFLDALQHDPEALTQYTHAEYAELAGMEGAEIIMWLIMRGALSSQVACVHRQTHLPSMTNIATVIYENQPSPLADTSQQHRQFIERQLAGVDEIPGTHPFTLERAHKAYRINDFLHRLIEPNHRHRFISEPESLYQEFALTQAEQDLLQARDWIGLIHYGVIFFSLEKLAAVLGLSNLDVYAQMSGKTLAEFQQTRQVAINYSVSGSENQDTDSNSDNDLEKKSGED
ncbi:gallate dioxygenase [Halioxenophilus aromaticivorans]|uniref:Gallate dioxygenase n=1 Tax=Halioxenophilus aromaticivorans TaxID=1306992 RepID=A0AAV3U3R0_9ALTE